MADNKAFVVFNRIVWLDLQRGFILPGKGLLLEQEAVVRCNDNACTV
ncbi:Uncharacterised protein [Klebsiella michiganensis]|uniref:Uncharacterized protein n=1 Tax=Klebsiella michiganensis TaxID=1134687 RepID=A0A7H4M155_9ENTR|nr:Uncharacterised protein [Klebsiella michiganensis]